MWQKTNLVFYELLQQTRQKKVNMCKVQNLNKRVVTSLLDTRLLNIAVFV